MKKKLLLTFLLGSISIASCHCSVWAGEIILENGMTFASEELFWEYLEAEYPTVTKDDVEAGKYTGQYVIMDSVAKNVENNESIELVTCDMYYLTNDESYEKISLWLSFYSDADVKKNGLLSGQDCLSNLQENDMLRGCYLVNSDNSFGSSNMLAIKKIVGDGSEADTHDTVTFNISKSVNNDKTGKWRLATTSTSHDIISYAHNYYNAFFSSKDEIHGIINYYDQTTSCLSIVGGELSVTVHEYIDNEENDAAILFGGPVIAQYYINLETGEISKN